MYKNEGVDKSLHSRDDWINKSIKQRKPPEVFCKKPVLKSYAKLTWKHLCQGFILIKLQAKVCNFVKNGDSETDVFLRTLFLTEHLRWLLLYQSKKKQATS